MTELSNFGEFCSFCAVWIRKGSDMESLVERFEAFGEFCVMFFGFSLGKTSKKHGKTCKNMETQWLYSR